MSDALVERAVFEVFARKQRALDLLIISKTENRWSAHDIKEYMLKFEAEVEQAIKAAYKGWYLTEHEIERQETTANPTKTEGE